MYFCQLLQNAPALYNDQIKRRRRTCCFSIILDYDLILNQLVYWEKKTHT